MLCSTTVAPTSIKNVTLEGTTVVFNNGRSYEYKKCYTNRSDRYSAITVAPISIIFLYKKERPLLTTTVAPSCIKNVILIGATVIVL